jgi:hypothetical protein
MTVAYHGSIMRSAIIISSLVRPLRVFGKLRYRFHPCPSLISRNVAEASLDFGMLRIPAGTDILHAPVAGVFASPTAVTYKRIGRDKL